MVKIQFETGNSYFEDDEEGRVRADCVAQIVRNVSDAIGERGTFRDNATYSGTIRDDNGNAIGTWDVGDA